ncbi:hypothetical protein CVO74_19345 [Xanthomonas prunicola]|uniref:Uncharacterized protein n=1 Tax=Xanthomonas prunicola TaxID=2053930 RepID=A0A2N3RGD3_9XANT|nr:hypothetical protein XpruCFBP8353_17095 [Xanthomonas prunicola]PKV15617.1 hypothetical protein XpruCFBP8354_18215 [Xanthomonas prunicola]PKV19663.1 hypothetical protein CVO74_19345 [Xanthomonas prunicola]
MGATWVIDEIAGTTSAGAAGDIRTTAAAGAAAAVAITVGPAAAAKASSNAERRHSNGTVVWIM